MTSGVFATIPLDSIIIERAARQRRTLARVDEIAESISRTGLIHPPIVTRDHVLVSGETRIEACRSLGWTSISVQWADTVDPLQLQLIELEENVRRVDLDWKDQCLAVSRYHDLRKGVEPSWTEDQTGEALGFSRSYITRQLDVAKELSTNKLVQGADKFSVAHGIVSRNAARKRTEAIHGLFNKPHSKEDLRGSDAQCEEFPQAPATPLINADFIEWAASYTGPRFNFLHCDFPYGVSIGGHGQAADGTFGNYEDTPDVYWCLLDALGNNLDRVVSESAHLMFWFSMKYYKKTFDALMDMGWRVGMHPLIWGKSDNTGILPDARRGPRQVYETAFHCFRGDRPVVQAVSNTYWGPSPKTVHMSEKPVAMLSHFFRLYVDQHSHVLDPTCGSGNALKAALTRGAGRVLGIERNPDFHAAAVANWS